jgi:hypothetical protein
MVAVEGRNEAMVKLLLAAGADPHGVTESDRMNALHVLAEQDHRNPAWQDVPPPRTHSHARTSPHAPPHTTRHATHSVVMVRAQRQKKGGKEGEDASVAYSPIFEMLIKAGADPNATNAMGEVRRLCQSS